MPDTPKSGHSPAEAEEAEAEAEEEEEEAEAEAEEAEEVPDLRSIPLSCGYALL
jgi:hypothetical protein